MKEATSAMKFSKYEPDKLEEISRRGGIRSGEARRLKKQQREFLTALANAVTKGDYACGKKGEYLKQAKKQLKACGYKPGRNSN